MKKILILALALLFCILSITLISCEDEEVSCEQSSSSEVQIESQGLEFSLNEELNSYLVTGIGTCTDTNIVIPNTYDNRPVIAIGAQAFYDCDSITSITIPNSVTSIAREAFFDCSSLTNVIIEGNVTSIGHNAFRNCTSLINITIEDSVTSIAIYELHNFISLINITVAENNVTYKSIDGILYDKAGTTLICYPVGKKDASFTIPNNVSSIGNRAFYGCTSLTSITIPDSVTEIGELAFYNCSSLANVTIPNSVTSLELSAFASCTSLTSVTISNNLASIGARAFYGCYKLVEVYNLSSHNITTDSYSNGYVIEYATIIHTSLDEPSILETVDDYIFMTWEGKYYLMGYVGNETELTLPDTYKGNNYEIYKYAFYERNDITKVTIPDNVTSIGSYAFSSCTSLTSVTIGNGVTSIGNSAFDSCDSLASIVIPNGVTSIGEGAFSNCTFLTNVTIPNSVTSIGYMAFYKCTSLTIYCEATSKPSEWNSRWNSSMRPVYWYNESEPTVSGKYWHYGDNGEIVVWAQN